MVIVRNWGLLGGSGSVGGGVHGALSCHGSPSPFLCFLVIMVGAAWLHIFSEPWKTKTTSKRNLSPLTCDNHWVLSLKWKSKGRPGSDLFSTILPSKGQITLYFCTGRHRRLFSTGLHLASVMHTPPLFIKMCLAAHSLYYPHTPLQTMHLATSEPRTPRSTCTTYSYLWTVRSLCP